MQLHVFDTNIIIYAFADKPPCAQLLRECIVNESLGVSVIVMAEFLTGATKKEEHAFERLIAYFDPLAVNGDIARIAASYRKRYFKEIKLPDALIAATCKVYNAILVTNNQRDFPMDDIQKRLL